MRWTPRGTAATLAATAAAVMLATIPAGSQPGPSSVPSIGLSRAIVFGQVKALTAIGRKMFSDPVLSASGKLSCASCHSPAHAYGPPNARPVQPGGADMRSMGIRAVPNLTYTQTTPQFTEHFHDSDHESDESADGGPTGGLTWDGRVDRGRDQALLPLLSPLEMANRDRASLAAVIEANYGAALRVALGSRMPQGPEATLQAGLKAIEAFEQDHTEFFPYTSKYDAYLAGEATLTAQEARGLAAFNDPDKGNCAHCHRSAPGGDGGPPQFTDYGMIALGLPRNREIPANRDPNFFDLGLCGPERTDFKDHNAYCGLFKAPSLRNVVLRKTFFHNGVSHTLRDAIAFYVERDTKPEKWYPHDAHGVRKFDDLPPQYHENINVEPPFGGHPGDDPALSEAEIEDMVAFLGTLTDGYEVGGNKSP